MQRLSIQGRPERDFGMEGLDDEEFLLEANTFLESLSGSVALPGVIDNGEDEEQEAPPKSCQLYVGYGLFFLCGIGLSMAWYSISASAGYYSYEYGPSIYQLFLACYNVPALPLLLAQTKWDGTFDTKYGANTAYWVRLTVTVGILGTAVGSLPYLPLNKIVLLVIVGFVGIFDSVGYGAFSQLSSAFPEKCITFVFLGQSMSSILLLIITLLTKFSTYPPPFYAVRVYFGYATFWVALGFVAWIILARSRFGRYYLSRAGKTPPDNSYQIMQPVTFGVVFKKIWKVVFSITYLYFGILLVTSFFTVVPAEDPSPAGESMMTTFMIYINLFGTFVGKQLSLIKKSPIVGQKSLLLAVNLLNLFVIPFHLYLSDYFLLLRNDWAIRVAVSLYCIAAGYIGSNVYRIGSSELAPNQRALGTSILNIFLQVGVVGGVLSAIALTSLFPRG